MSFVGKVAPNRFRVQFKDAPAATLASSVASLFRGRSAVVDPYRMAQALVQTLRLCDMRATSGAPLAWNEFRFFLSRTDYDAIRAVLRRTSAGLDTVIRKELDRLKAETVGEPIIRIGYDESAAVPDGEGVILVDFKEDREIGPDDDHEITIRVGRRAGVTPRAVAAPTAPEASPSGADASLVDRTLRLRWGEHQALILPGSEARVGRSHPGAPPDFIALEGAPELVNRVMLLIDNRADQVIVTRLPGTNAVHVGASLVQPGGKFGVVSLPAKITLCNDGLVLHLEGLA